MGRLIQSKIWRKKLNVIGIDAAWTEKQPSGICWIETIDGNVCEIKRIASSYSSFLFNRIDINVKPTGSVPSIKDIQ